MAPRFGSLEGQVALVSGAAPAIGAAIAARFVDEGARVVLADTSVEKGELVAKSLGAAVTFVPLDVRAASDWHRAVATAIRTFGSPPTVLVHNAGVMVRGTVEFPDELAVRRAFELNVLGPTLGTAACVPGMKEAGGGAVVIISSIAAVTGGAEFVPYAMGEAANAAYARCAAQELGPYGIRVNILQPGEVDRVMGMDPDSPLLRRVAPFGRMAVTRMGRPGEIAAGALYLASGEASFVTGATLIMDGGQMLGPYPGEATPFTAAN